MKQTTKNFFRLFPTYLLSFLLCAAAFIAGYFTKGNFTTAGIAVFAASLFIIAFLTITGKIYGFYHAKKSVPKIRWKKKITGMNLLKT